MGVRGRVLRRKGRLCKSREDRQERRGEERY
jgi:hypothetical protein